MPPTRRVIIIEPSFVDRMRLVTNLESMGITTIAVGTLADAQKALQDRRVGLALVNVNVPNGKHLFDELRRRDRPPIVLLAESDADRAAESLKSKEDLPILNKPLSSVDLRLIRQTMLDFLYAHRKRKRKRIPPPTTPGTLLGSCSAMRELYATISKVATSDSPVLISGESGTGKELVARDIHNRGGRSAKPYITVNCGAIPETLIESELFGHIKGAFTGANTNRRGVFEQAHGGTLFLDEIGEMPMEMQVRLLRVIESKVVTRVGDDKEIKVDVRLIAATNRKPSVAIEQGRLREDLVYRLAVFPITLPPLRERGEDILLLAHEFVEQLNRQQQMHKELTPRAEARLKRYDWPGNVRQLRNTIERAFVIGEDVLDLEMLDEMIAGDDPIAPPVNGNNGKPPLEAKESGVTTNTTPAPEETRAVRAEMADEVIVQVGDTIEQAERKLIEATLQATDGDKPTAADLLGISLKTLYNRLHQYEEDDMVEVSPTVPPHNIA